jgi:hypothetical protein
MSKRVSNARSELHYRRTGPMKKKKEESVWQSMRNQISTHPLLIAFIFVIMIMSGIASFFMHDRTTRSMFGQSVAVETD